MRYLFLVVLATMLVFGGCSNDSRPGGSDSDSDSDTDTDGDTDSDSDSDTDTGYLPMTDCEGGKYDPNFDLCWEDPYFAQWYSWDDAVAYCEDLVVGESDNWRLPTITELRSLARGCPATEVGGSCQVYEDSPLADETDECKGCDEHMGPGNGGCYWDEGLIGDCEIRFWSSSEVSDVSEHSWGKGQTEHVLCVRDGQ